MNIAELVGIAKDKSKFNSLSDYIEFCLRYLEFIESGLQAIIVSQNAQHYRFFQYQEEGYFNITRPINADLLYNANDAALIEKEFLNVLLQSKDVSSSDQQSRKIICRSIYTIQQSIGATLDALPSGQSNTARKINGDLFERLMQILIREVGVDCRGGVINVPVVVDDREVFKMNYQHDLLIYSGEKLKVIGSVKTSSKDRLDKIFIDKFLYSKLTETSTPHIAIFLNDVQRKQTKKENKYGVSSTFLPGRFKGYTIKLNPLDGIYYCDILPIMSTDSFLKQQIKTIDCLFCDDLQGFMHRMIIAIDGPSGAGKSTLGKRLAKHLGLLYIDTGAMYRAVALAAIEAGVDLENKEAVAKLARRSEITLAGEPDSLQVFLNGRNVSQEIRTEEVSQAASRVSTISDVRRTLVERQRILGQQGAGCVMDGRDVGTVIFPNANIKFFLTALPEARAHRRYEEDVLKSRASSFEDTLTDIIERDTRDTTRTDSPLVKANDAIEIDSSDLTIDEVLERMLSVISGRQ